MRRVFLTVATWLALAGAAFAGPNEVKLFGDVLTRVQSEYVTQPTDKELVKAAIQALLKLQPENPAAAFANQKLAKLPAARSALIATFGEVYDKFRQSGPKESEDGVLITAALGGMLASLDPHSTFLDARAYRDMQTTMRGEFGGLGIEVSMEDGKLTVVTPLDGTPAARAGLQPNDVISHADGTPIAGMSLAAAVDKLRGKVGTTVKLKVERQGIEPFEQSVVREIIRVNPVSSRMEGTVGYVRLSQFNERTADAFRTTVEKVRREGGPKMKGLVIDLRNNPGGLLDQSLQVTDDLLDAGEIVSVRGRRARDSARMQARIGDVARGLKIAILINGGSASASEIVTGSLRDHKRVTVIGTTSYGKGSVQTVIPLGAQGALRLTTAKYVLPKGETIDGKGIVPDIVVEQDEGTGAAIPKDKTKDKQLLAALAFIDKNETPPQGEIAERDRNDPPAPGQRSPNPAPMGGAR